MHSFLNSQINNNLKIFNLYLNQRKIMDYEKLCQDVLELESKIRFAGVANTKGTLVSHKYQKGVDEYLSESELGMSLHYSIQVWEKSKNLHHKIGNQTAFTGEYDKVTLISIPINNSELFVASTEPGEDYFHLIEKIKPLLTS